MKHLLFKIINQNPTEINLSRKDMLDFPVHEHYLDEQREIIIRYSYKPTKKTAEKTEQLIERLKKHFKQQYNAISVTVYL